MGNIGGRGRVKGLQVGVSGRKSQGDDEGKNAGEGRWNGKIKGRTGGELGTKKRMTTARRKTMSEQALEGWG